MAIISTFSLLLISNLVTNIKEKRTKIKRNETSNEHRLERNSLRVQLHEMPVGIVTLDLCIVESPEAAKEIQPKKFVFD